MEFDYVAFFGYFFLNEEGEFRRNVVKLAAKGCKIVDCKGTDNFAINGDSFVGVVFEKADFYEVADVDAIGVVAGHKRYSSE